MDEKPATAEPGKQRGRRFRFKLRTLLIVVAMIALALAWEAHVVAKRKAVISTYEKRGATFFAVGKFDGHPIGTLLWIRVLLAGDRRVDYVHLPNDEFTERDVEDVRGAFPEAVVKLGYGRWVH